MDWSVYFYFTGIQYLKLVMSLSQVRIDLQVRYVWSSLELYFELLI